jgi:hypothetical protein
MQLSWACVYTACSQHQGADVIRNQTEPAPAHLKEVVDRINLIQGLPPKSGEPQTDQYAKAIMALGKRAGPYLVDKLTDSSVTQVTYGFRYAVGDLALALLDEIYEPRGWPFPDDQIKIPEKYGDYRDYVEFVSAPGSRERLKQSWREYIKTR